MITTNIEISSKVFKTNLMVLAVRVNAQWPPSRCTDVFSMSQMVVRWNVLSQGSVDCTKITTLISVTLSSDCSITKWLCDVPCRAGDDSENNSRGPQSLTVTWTHQGSKADDFPRSRWGKCLLLQVMSNSTLSTAV